MSAALQPDASLQRRRGPDAAVGNPSPSGDAAALPFHHAEDRRQFGLADQAQMEGRVQACDRLHPRQQPADVGQSPGHGGDGQPVDDRALALGHIPEAQFHTAPLTLLEAGRHGDFGDPVADHSLDPVHVQRGPQDEQRLGSHVQERALQQPTGRGGVVRIHQVDPAMEAGDPTCESVVPQSVAPDAQRCELVEPDESVAHAGRARDGFVDSPHGLTVAAGARSCPSDCTAVDGCRPRQVLWRGAAIRRP